MIVAGSDMNLGIMAMTPQVMGVPERLADPMPRLKSADENLGRAVHQRHPLPHVAPLRDLSGQLQFYVDRGTYRRARIKDTPNHDGAGDKARIDATLTPVVSQDFCTQVRASGVSRNTALQRINPALCVPFNRQLLALAPHVEELQNVVEDCMPMQVSQC